MVLAMGAFDEFQEKLVGSMSSHNDPSVKFVNKVNLK